MTVTLTLAVTAHAEGWVAGPSMESAERAVALLEAVGHGVELIVALDNPTDATAEFFGQACFDHWRHRELSEGDPGRVRNIIAQESAGRFLAFLDADDLFSENWLVEGVRSLLEAETRGERVIGHPELNVIFDGGHQLNQNVDQDSPLFTPHFLYIQNCYDTLSIAPREAHLEVPYGKRDLANSLSREDWQFAIETMARGWRHVVVRDTIIFKRRRDFSLIVESGANKALVRSLPEMAIDRIGRIRQRDLG